MFGAQHINNVNLEHVLIVWNRVNRQKCEFEVKLPSVDELEPFLEVRFDLELGRCEALVTGFLSFLVYLSVIERRGIVGWTFLFLGNFLQFHKFEVEHLLVLELAPEGEQPHTEEQSH